MTWIRALILLVIFGMIGLVLHPICQNGEQEKRIREAENTIQVLADGTDRRIYIVDEAQRLSKAAQDTFLKAVESRLFVAILCTTEPHKIVGPLRDRLEEYSVRPPSPDELVNRLVSICAAESNDVS